MSFVRWFRDIIMADVAEVGGKNASLGELHHAFGASDMRMPDGFAVTTEGYRAFIRANNLEATIREQVGRLQEQPEELPAAGAVIRSAILTGELPESLGQQIQEAYRILADERDMPDLPVAVRSSASAEDLPGASFAGQQESYLGVSGEKALLDAVVRCYASLFTDRAMSYREAHGFDQCQVAMSVGVHEMVAWPECESAGVAFTVDPETGFSGAIVITGSWGVGELVVQGRVSPDEYVVAKPMLAVAGSPIVRRRIGRKERRLTALGEEETLPEDRRRPVLDDDELIRLAGWVAAIERHYGKAMDIEWAKDAQTRQLYILQARPETVHSTQAEAPLRSFQLMERSEPIVQGLSVGQAIACGPGRVVTTFGHAAEFERGDVLVAPMTSPDWVPLMRKAAAIVTDSGGRTSHAAIVSRELGVPAIVGTGTATGVVHDGEPVTVSCAEGATGYVYRGCLRFEESAVQIEDLPTTRTQVMLNLAIPDAAFRWWRLPHDGIGLARIEFIIDHDVRAHPMALLHPDRVHDPLEQAELAKLTDGYSSAGDYFVSRLAEGIGMIAASAYPRPAIVRFSDFKTNEYARLLGGAAFEPAEANPMLGWRGASRYYDPAYREAFALECEAMRKVREDMGLTNVIPMIPFCRTPEEADRVLAEMSANGLERGKDGLEVYLMCELPSNVVMAEEFAERVDGFSIGSNDLTQLALGIDRDSASLARLFDERNPTVLRLIRSVIETAHRCGRKVGICGQAPSDHPEFARFLAECKIDSISVNPDSFARTKQVVADAEAET